MKAAFHYVVRIKIALFNKDNEVDLQEYESKFENENPILARNKAFDYYQTNIDNFLLNKNKTYTSDRQAREVLNSFIDLGTKAKYKIGDREVEYNDSFGNGIGVYLVVDKPILSDKHQTLIEDKVGDEFFLHGIKSIGILSHETIDTGSMMFGLTNELNYYKHYRYNTKNKEITIIYCDQDEWDEPDNEEPSTNNILETPFDWDGYGEPYWWGKPVAEEQANTKKPQLTVEKIIQQGESNKVEFKSSLLYNFKTKAGGIGIKEGIAKAICAFLNSNGGVLFIGVRDDKTVQGLNDYDFQLANGKDSKDFFLREYDQMIEYFLSSSVKSGIEGYFYEIGGKEIFVVIVSPNKRRPIFLKSQGGGKDFYIRLEASSRKLTDIEEIINYFIDRNY